MSTPATCDGCGKQISVIRFGASAPAVCAGCGPTFEPPKIETDPVLRLAADWQPR
jgi:hypothetical protein